MKNLRVGIVGVGNIAKFGHIPSYRKIPNVDLIATSDLNMKKARLIADQFEIPFSFNDYNEMFDKCELDAISICTPPETHSKIAIEAATFL